MCRDGLVLFREGREAGESGESETGPRVVSRQAQVDPAGVTGKACGDREQS